MAENLKLTYMLPPTLSLIPDRDISLGILLPLSYEKPKVPDPECNLTNSPDYPLPDQSLIKYEREEPWEYGEAYKKSISAGVWADIPVLSVISASLGFSRSNDNDIAVEAKRVETCWFTPTREYIAAALKQPLAREYLLQNPKAPVFMVTGFKVAYDASITFGRDKARQSHAKLGADLSSLGAPLRVGPELARSSSREVHFHTEKAGPFVLAYQLKRIREKKDESFRVKGYNSRAFLFDDEVDESELGLEEQWDVEDVMPGMVLAEE